MDNLTFTYILAIVAMHFGVVFGVVILITLSYSIRGFVSGQKDSASVSLVLSGQLRYFPVIVVLATLAGTVSLFIAPGPARALHWLTLGFDVLAPLVVLVRTVKK
jgi:hypothetical protein